MLQGSPAIGIAFTLKGFTSGTFLDVTIFFVASCLLVAHVFAFNDWADLASDLKDPMKAHTTFLNAGLHSRQMLLLSLGLGLVSLILFSLLPFRTMLLAFGTMLCGLLYSDLYVRAKEIPILSSVLHMAGGLLHFLAGYSLFGVLEEKSVLIGSYFALLFVAGHLIQEVRDFDGDRRAGTITNAVRFGRRRAFIASFVLFSASYAYLASLIYRDVLATPFLLVLGAYPVQILMFWHLFRKKLVEPPMVARFQLLYRLLYGAIGLAICAGLLGGFV